MPDALLHKAFLTYEVIAVAGPDHPTTKGPVTASRAREQTWLLGPSAAADLGAVPALLRKLAVPEERQQIFQSHAAAIEEAKRSKGVAPVLSFAVGQDLARGHLCRVTGPVVQMDAMWHALTLASRGTPPAAAELARFASTPRAIQAMVRGKGVNVGHFKPSIHVTLWS
jgi:LysR family transcriptional regulator, low CO2-responsive transcriptional regulator